MFAALLLGTVQVTGCHPRAEDPAAVTPDEQAQLNDAATMLDVNGLSANDADAATPDNDD